jgi:anti-sigma factor RsiW
MRLRRRRPLSCQELVELVTDYLEGALPARDRRRFDEHIAGCPHCTAYLEQMQITIRTVGRLREDAIDPQMRDELLAAFRDWTSDR